MAALVIDTNVFVAASGDSSASLQCELAAFQFIAALKDTQDHVIVDHDFKILGEYLNNLKQAAIPQSIGFELYKRLHDEGRFDYQIIAFDDAGYAILPHTCQTQDLNDRKFVAVALAHPDRPNIYNATDSDWKNDQAKLAECGVCVVQLCAS
ncbi:MAG: hypothetical protein KIH69_000115 [Anaerolineae bacterium]|nr:hypothetical protein [Anaerolineae bacterium]